MVRIIATPTPAPMPSSIKRVIRLPAGAAMPWADPAASLRARHCRGERRRGQARIASM
jgi:hypothetical protein